MGPDEYNTTNSGYGLASFLSPSVKSFSSVADGNTANLVNLTPTLPKSVIDYKELMSTINPVKNYSTVADGNTSALGNVSSVDTATETPWYEDGSRMQGYAGLASSLMQAIALPTQLKTAKLQQSALRQNIQTAREDQARRNTAINNINRKVI